MREAEPRLRIGGDVDQVVEIVERIGLRLRGRGGGDTGSGEEQAQQAGTNCHRHASLDRRSRN
ncbi:MAG: hypothetical protein WDN31_02235 [Hyphomicrobium sp.]